MTMKPMKRALFFAAFVASLGGSTSAHAIASYQTQVPNGGTFRCLTCHERSGGGEGWNEFGQGILVAGGANPSANPDNQNDGFNGSAGDYWLEVCGDDSDGDGATNGEELGDPDCVWAAGDPNPAVDVGNPGDAASTPTDPGAEGEGEGEGEVGGCAAVPVDSPTALLAALGLVALRRRR